MPPINGYAMYYPHTREGITITFQCNLGYVPSIARITTCNRHGRWVPAPQQYNCSIVTGTYVFIHFQFCVVTFITLLSFFNFNSCWAELTHTRH